MAEIKHVKFCEFVPALAAKCGASPEELMGTAMSLVAMAAGHEDRTDPVWSAFIVTKNGKALFLTPDSAPPFRFVSVRPS